MRYQIQILELKKCYTYKTEEINIIISEKFSNKNG